MRIFLEASIMFSAADEAAGGYVGDLERLRNSIDLAVRIVEDAERAAGRRGRRR